MPARNPEDIDRLFGAALNAGNLDALVALYEPEATFTAQPGQVVSGHAAIRDALSGFLASRPTLTIEPKVLARAKDIALVSSRWSLKGTGPDGKPLELNGHSVEVVRQQADGSWLFVIDTPWGLEWGQ